MPNPAPAVPAAATDATPPVLAGHSSGGLLRGIKLFFLNAPRRLWSNIHHLIALLLLLVIALLFLWKEVVIVIRPGEGGVLYRPFFGGTITDYVYPEGLHVILPWDEMYVYNVRIQTVKHDFTVLTNKGLPIDLKLAIRYRPEYEMVGVLHQRVGPEYVDTIVIPQIESVLRRHIGRYAPEDVYTNKEGILTDVIVRALEETGQKYVFVEDIIIRAVELPTEIKDAIAEKLVQEQHAKAYEFRLSREHQEAERKRVEARGIKDYQETISQTLNQDLLHWQGVQATLELAKSDNTKVVVIGAGEHGLPLILGGQ